jgi:hypothetical protein
MCTNGSGTNSVMRAGWVPELRFCRSRSASTWAAQWPGESRWPNMMVEVVGRPTEWAASTICGQVGGEGGAMVLGLVVLAACCCSCIWTCCSRPQPAATSLLPSRPSRQEQPPRCSPGPLPPCRPAHLEPLRCTDLVGAQLRAHLVLQHLRSSAGEAAQPRLLEQREVLGCRGGAWEWVKARVDEVVQVLCTEVPGLTVQSQQQQRMRRVRPQQPLAGAHRRAGPARWRPGAPPAG